MKKIEHLKLIQEVIGRLSAYSNTIKSWTVSLVTITITLGFSIDSGKNFELALILVLIITTLFMILDSYYFMIEKKYRNLFEEVRTMRESEIDFRMSITKDKYGKMAKTPESRVSPLIGFKSPSILMLYLPIIFIGLITLILI